MNEATQTVPCTRKEIKLTPKQEVNFWKKVNKDGPTMPHMDSPCWIWTASKNNKGYGSFGVGERSTRSTHRIAWTLAEGQIPHDGSYHGIQVCHKCDNPACCRFDHLFLGTMADNNRDKINKGRCNIPRGDNHHARRHPERMCRGDNHPARLRPGWRRGIANGRAKLTAEKVVEIREIHAAGGATKMALAEKFGVSDNQIGYIIRRVSWAHIP